MIRLYAEQLTTQVQGALRPCYLLFGNDLFLLQESQDCIRKLAQGQQFNEYFSVTLDVYTNWDDIFSVCQMRSLFAIRQMLLLILPTGNIDVPIAEKMLQLASLLNEDVLLILRGGKLSRATENSAWFKALSQNGVLVSCVTPEQAQMPRWVARRAERMKLTLDDAACQLLCYYYEGNLQALVQALERLSLLYPKGNLTLPQVTATVNKAGHFTPFQWVDASLAGKNKRAMYILRQLRLESMEPIILLRSIQREVLLLLMLKRQVATMPVHTLFDHYNVWRNRRTFLTQVIKRLTLSQLRDTVALMMKIELALKQDHNYPVWPAFSALTLLLCGKSLPVAIFNV
ncbi:MAG: DNA polymerase III subunit delta [Sodalis sp. (in: enterobacteria)]